MGTSAANLSEKLPMDVGVVAKSLANPSTFAIYVAASLGRLPTGRRVAPFRRHARDARVVGDEAAGIGVREDPSRIITGDSRLVPHFFR
jgi:hypothetical protein